MCPWRDLVFPWETAFVVCVVLTKGSCTPVSGECAPVEGDCVLCEGAVFVEFFPLKSYVFGFADMKTDYVKVEPLLGSSNYKKWYKSMSVLQTEGLWLLVNGWETSPEPPKRGKDDSFQKSSEKGKEPEYDESDPTFLQEKKEWATKNYKALGLIRGSLSDHLQDVCINANNAAKLWDQLKHFDVQASDCGIEGLVEAVNLRIEDCKDGNDFVCRMRAALMKHESSFRNGKKLGEHQKVQFLIMSLQGDWQYWLSSFLAAQYKQDVTTFEEVAEALVKEDRRRRRYYEGTANRVKGRGQRGQKEIVCYHCNKKGHKKADCWDLHPEKRPQKDQEDQSLANLARGCECDDDDTVSGDILLMRDDFTKMSRGPVSPTTR